MTKYPLEWGWDQPETSKASVADAPKPKSTLLGGRDGDIDIAAAGDLKCEGPPCKLGGSWGTTGMYRYKGKILCHQCAVKERGIEDLPGGEQIRILRPYLLGGS
jgi:hypothetical protein